MTEALIVLYALGAIQGFRLVLRSFIHGRAAPDGRLSWGDAVGGLLVAACYGAVIGFGGPLVYAYQYLQHRDPDAGGLVRALAGESRADKIARLEASAEARERRIAELEQEVLRRE